MNLKLLCEAYRWGRDNEQHFNMGDWGARENVNWVQEQTPITACGTTGCLAGTIVHLDGASLLFHPGELSTIDAIYSNGRVVNIEERALELLQTSYSGLFYESNLHNVREVIMQEYNIDPDTYGLEEE